MLSEPDENWEREVIEDSEYNKMCNICAAASSRLLRNCKIQERNIEIMNGMLRNEVIDARMYRIIQKWKDVDSIAAIKEYNKLKQRIVEKQQLVDWDWKPFIPSVIRIVEAKPESDHTKDLQS